MHHRRQTDRFRGLGMFTRRCRLLRPQPESERRDGHRRPLGGNRILTRLRRGDGQPLSPGPPFPPQRPFCPNYGLFSSKEADTHTGPLCWGVGTGSGGLMSSVHIHVQSGCNLSALQTEVRFIRKDLKEEAAASHWILISGYTLHLKPCSTQSSALTLVDTLRGEERSPGKVLEAESF